MKHLPIFLISLILHCTFGCANKHQSVEFDPLAQYRDMLVGNFNGLELDTLIAEPIGEKDNGNYTNWIVYTKNGSVKDIIIGNTIGIHFVFEGDLDRDGTDGWGYVTEWITSNWMAYHAFTNVNGEWRHIIEPTPIWLPHIDPQDSLYYTISKDDILQPSENKDFLKVKFSDIRHDGEDFLIIDTLIQINPQPIQ